jgi:hypothetical protein
MAMPSNILTHSKTLMHHNGLLVFTTLPIFRKKEKRKNVNQICAITPNMIIQFRGSLIGWDHA